MAFDRSWALARPAAARVARAAAVLALAAAAALWLVPRGGRAAGPASAPAAPGAGAAPALESVLAAPAAQPATAAYDGVVEAVRQTVIAAQVSGAVLQLHVKAGDRVRAGQVLMRLDARAADQNAVASEAQVRAARAAQEVAEKEVARQRQLAADRFISAAALDRAEAEYKAATAQAAALLAQAGAARTQTGFFVVSAPYAGVVSEVPVTLGDMALPGRALLTLHDPAALRVSAALPQSVAAMLGDGRGVRVELPSLRQAGAAPGLHTPARVQLLPAADAATHTATLRAELPAGLQGLAPGQFARVWLPVAVAAGAAADGRTAPNPWVPLQAVVRRAEMTGLYVLNAEGRPLLRQVRLGRSDGTQVEVLAGLNAGERVAVQAQAAARLALAGR
jgi:RND family efflux transporter MFP subunit